MGLVSALKITAFLVASLICLTAGAAFAEGDGGFGLPQSPLSLPSGFVAGTAAPNDTVVTLSEDGGQKIAAGTIEIASASQSAELRR